MDLDTLFDAAMAGDAAAVAELEIEADRLHRYEETILQSIISININIITSSLVRYIVEGFLYIILM